MGNRKCLYCEDPITPDTPDDQIKKIKNRYAHLKCFELHVEALDKGYKIQKKEKSDIQKEQKTQKAKKPKSIEEVKKGLTEQEFQEKQILFEYLKSILEDHELKPQHYALISKYMDEFNYSYLMLYQIMFYIFSILVKPVKSNPVGLVPYYADEAIKYYKELKDIEERNKDKDIRQMYKKQIVKIKRRTEVPEALKEWQF